MAIKEHWNRFISRKSISSTSSSAGEFPNGTARPIVSAPAAPGHPPSRPPTTTTTTTTTGGGSSSDAPRPRGLISKAFSWRPHRSRKQLQSPATAKVGRHPSEKPLTETNLYHQEMLGSFTMQFGRRRASRATAFSGVSPGSSRPPSRDARGGGGGEGGVAGAG